MSGMSREQFLADEKTVDAVARHLESIGERRDGLPDGPQGEHQQIPSDEIAGLRNRIVHDYFGLDLAIIWQVLQTSLPDLRQQLERITW